MLSGECRVVESVESASAGSGESVGSVELRVDSVESVES